MSDYIQLLEAAARAAGLPWDQWVIDGDDSWNPLTDDGDALRLAVKLGLWVASDNDLGQTFVADDPEGGGRVALIEWHSRHADRYAATRRAVVRAAAELARGMEARQGRDAQRLDGEATTARPEGTRPGDQS